MLTSDIFSITLNAIGALAGLILGLKPFQVLEIPRMYKFLDLANKSEKQDIYFIEIECCLHVVQFCILGIIVLGVTDIWLVFHR